MVSGEWVTQFMSEISKGGDNRGVAFCCRALGPVPPSRAPLDLFLLILRLSVEHGCGGENIVKTETGEEGIGQGRMNLISLVPSVHRMKLDSSLWVKMNIFKK